MGKDHAAHTATNHICKRTPPVSRLSPITGKRRSALACCSLKKLAVTGYIRENTGPPEQGVTCYCFGLLLTTSGAVVSIFGRGAGDQPATTPTVFTLHAVGCGDGIVQPFSLQLAGGEDEPFPLNTPVAVVGTTLLSRLGEKGTLKQALTDINDQRNALTVVVRVADENDVAKRRAAVLKGIGTLSSAKSVTTYQPRIVIAPGFSEDDAVGKGLETVAGKLRAVAYVDCTSGATLQEVVQRRQSYGARTELLRPRVQASDADGQLVYRPYSAFAAGLRARIDFEKGWWWSKSNQDINNILGVEQIDEFILGDENCDANLLNMQNVSTIIRRAGFKHWGNRLCATNPQWRFESVRRTADVIEDSIQETMLEYVDRPLDRENADDIIGTINAYMRQLVGLGAIFGGRAWLDEELNTAETMASGVLYINYDFGPKSPTELISLRVRVNNNYALEEMLAA